MQAVILAAGMGRRLQELTIDRTKCMIEVAGKLIIDRILNDLKTFNLSRVIIVTGHGAKELERHVLSTGSGLNIVFIYNELYMNTNNIYSLSLAKDLLIEDDCIVLESDIVFQEGILADLIDSAYSNISVVAKYEYWMEGTMVQIDQYNNITKLISKDSFDISKSDSYYKTVNIYKFSKEFLRLKYIPFLEAYIVSFGQNQFYEQVLNILAFIDKSDLHCLVLQDKKWYEIDDQQDLFEANILFSEEDIVSKYTSCYGGYWRFPHLSDFCYLVNPYFPPQKFLQEFSAFSSKLLTSYPSGRVTNDFLASRLFDIHKNYTCVANGASELIKVLCTLLEGEIGVIYPTFEEYHNNLERTNIIPYIVRNQNLRYNVEDLMNFFSNTNVKTILLVNPDNPSGNYIGKQDLLQFVQWAKEREINIVVDESFLDFSGDPINNTLLKNDILEKFKTLIVIKSISKSYGVPGIRLGILASANTNIIEKIRKKLPVWNINSYAEFFLQTIKRYMNDYSSSCKRLYDERERFFKELSLISFLEVYPSEANYFLCKVLMPYSSSKLCHRLLINHNILVKDCTNKIGIKDSNLIRISIRNVEDNNSLIRVMKYIETEKNFERISEFDYSSTIC